MLTLCRLLFSSLLSLVRSRAALQAEILALRHQLQVLERSARGRRLRLRTADRIFWVWLSRLWTGWRTCVRVVQPATVISWNPARDSACTGPGRVESAKAGPVNPARCATSFEKSA